MTWIPAVFGWTETRLEWSGRIGEYVTKTQTSPLGESLVLTKAETMLRKP